MIFPRARSRRAHGEFARPPAAAAAAAVVVVVVVVVRAPARATVRRGARRHSPEERSIMPITRRPLLLPISRACAMLAAAAAVAAAAAAPSTAFAQDQSPLPTTEFSLGVGYANVTLDDSPVIDGESGIRFDPSLSFSPLPDALPQLRLGVAAGFTLVLDNSERALISSGGQLIFVGSSEVPLWLIEPELRISWRQWFDNRWFVEAGVGGGFAFGFLELDASDGSTDSYSENDSTPFGRAFFRAGGQATGGIAGIEGWYLVGDSMDFGGNAAGDLTEWYIGIFGALVF
jgi:hypothetical protein